MGINTVDEKVRKLREDKTSKLVTIPVQYQRFLKWWDDGTVVIELVREKGEHVLIIRGNLNE